MFTCVPWPDEVRSQESKYLGGGSLQVPEYLAYLLTKTLFLSTLQSTICIVCMLHLWELLLGATLITVWIRRSAHILRKAFRHPQSSIDQK